MYVLKLGYMLKFQWQRDFCLNKHYIRLLDCTLASIDFINKAHLIT